MTTSPKLSSPKPKPQAFTLVEVTLSLGVMSFCLLTLFGLLPTGLNSNYAAIAQSSAINVISSIHSDLKATPKSVAASSCLSLPLDKDSAAIYLNADGTLDTKAKARYRAMVYLKPGTGKGATTGRIVVSWPAQQDNVKLAAGMVETFIALDRN
jgi:hypothetical protein